MFNTLRCQGCQEVKFFQSNFITISVWERWKFTVYQVRITMQRFLFLQWVWKLVSHGNWNWLLLDTNFQTHCTNPANNQKVRILIPGNMSFSHLKRCLVDVANVAALKDASKFSCNVERTYNANGRRDRSKSRPPKKATSWFRYKKIGLEYFSCLLFSEEFSISE